MRETVFWKWAGSQVDSGSLVASRPRRFRMWRHLSSLSIALGSKPPLVTRIARTGLGTRLGLRYSKRWLQVFPSSLPAVYCSLAFSLLALFRSTALTESLVQAKTKAFLSAETDINLFCFANSAMFCQSTWSFCHVSGCEPRIVNS